MATGVAMMENQKCYIRTHIIGYCIL